jgi:hypothetical protein
MDKHSSLLRSARTCCSVSQIKASLYTISLLKGLKTALLIALTAEFPRTACILQQCRKTTALSCRRCLINSSVEKMNNI